MFANFTILAADAGHAADEGNAFGLVWEKFLAQVILFLIVYLILKKFAFGPIMGVLEERRKRIAAGEENLKKIAADLAAAEEKQAEIVGEANAKADTMIAEARESAEAVAEKKRSEATREAASIVAKAREAGDLERKQVLAELKRDFGRLVIDTTSKVTGKVLDDDDQRKLNDEAASQLTL